MSDKPQYNWMLFIHDNDEFEPWFVQSPEGRQLAKLKEEFRKLRGLGKKTEVSHMRMGCNVNGCSEWASTTIETQFSVWPPDPRSLESISMVDPVYLKQYVTRVGGRMATCLCERHHKRLTKSLLERVFRLEERVDELVKTTEQMHELFEYRSELD